ncbi:hypothetical protein TSOC_012984 [Tetrabaena socialis]|uniref:Protein NO VEIN C-terminal domain-containing protein n=1 Tax=Tetrabaena socialis TaxID=47790 RepID=A0A2J7ZLJ4_9CHLO|nr:hypothetical protein TSOC_012984 [Tetrabaena socialis]|eukprot:PNH01136.1 hypothetical protein TSOC_012984 [Tetrabaena socialis]
MAAIVKVSWLVELLPPAAGPNGPNGPPPRLLRSTVHRWVVGAATLAPPLVARGSAGARRQARGGRDVSQGTAAEDEVEGEAAAAEAEAEAEAAAEAAAAAEGGGGGGCYVYATLPIRPSGLPFDLQADWLVPSSREDISGGEAWNQMLRDQVPAAFLAAVRVAQRRMPAMRRGGWLRYVPHNGGGMMTHGAAGGGGGGAAMPFLRPVVGAVAAVLRAASCALSYGAAEGGGVGVEAEGEWLRPPQLVVAASMELRRLLPAPALRSATGLSYGITDGLRGAEADEQAGEEAAQEEEGQERAEGAEDAAGVCAALGLAPFAARHAVAVVQAAAEAEGPGGYFDEDGEWQPDTQGPGGRGLPPGQGGAGGLAGRADFGDGAGGPRGAGDGGVWGGGDGGAGRPVRGPAGIGALAQSSWAAPSGAFSEDLLEIGPEQHRAFTPGSGEGGLQLRVAAADAPRAAREAVGRWGEQYVAAYLRAKADAGTVVEWINDRNEQCLPYDVVVRDLDSGEVLSYIEVKATSSWDKTYFEVSHTEWLFAQQQGSRYHIFRMFGAGPAPPPPPNAAPGQPAPLPRIMRLVNPYLQWRSSRVGICLVL